MHLRNCASLARCQSYWENEKTAINPYSNNHCMCPAVDPTVLSLPEVRSWTWLSWTWMWELRSTLDLCGIQDACENAMMVLRYPRPFYLDPGFDLSVSWPGLCTILMYYIICILHIMHNIINQCYWVSMKQWNQLRLANVARIQLQSRFSMLCSEPLAWSSSCARYTGRPVIDQI